MQKKRIKTIIKISLIIVLFACVNLTNGVGRRVSILEEIASDIVTLPQRGIVYIQKLFKQDKNTFFKDIKQLKEENELLKSQIKELQDEMVDYEMVVAERENLKSHIALSEYHPNYKVVIADVILTSSSNWSLVYTINRGEKDGIKHNSVVICKEGLVGYVESTTAHTAKVVSILDAGNAVSGRITRTRDTVVAKGNLNLAKNNQMRITNIPVGVTLVEGDKIETSGLGGIYPKGLVIGKVTSFEQKNNPLENEAIAESYVKFDKLETVAVIVSEQTMEE